MSTPHLSAVLAAAIRLHDMVGTVFLYMDLVDNAIEDYRAGHPDIVFAEADRMFLAEKVATLLIQRAKDRGDVHEITEEPGDPACEP